MGTDENQAKQMLTNATSEGRSSVEAAVRRNFAADKADQLIKASPAGGGKPTPDVKQAPTANKADSKPPTDGKGQPPAKDPGAAGNKGAPAPAGAAGESGGEGEGGAATKVGEFQGMETEDLGLIQAELIEHEQWKAAQTHVGAAGSIDRAGFIAEMAGKGTESGAVTGLIMGAGTGLVTKLAERFCPIPGVGAVIAGGMAAYGLLTKDWKESGETIGKFGQGSDTYDVLANSIASVSEVIDIVVNVLSVIAGIIGLISAVIMAQSRSARSARHRRWPRRCPRSRWASWRSRRSWTRLLQARAAAARHAVPRAAHVLVAGRPARRREAGRRHREGRERRGVVPRREGRARRPAKRWELEDQFEVPDDQGSDPGRGRRSGRHRGEGLRRRRRTRPEAPHGEGEHTEEPSMSGQKGHGGEKATVRRAEDPAKTPEQKGHDPENKGGGEDEGKTKGPGGQGEGRQRAG